MNLLSLSWKNLVNKPLSMLLSLVLFALGVGLISLLFLLNQQLQDKFEKNLAGIDLVVGAKGSPLQLILSSMYHIDAPTGNISIQEAMPFLRPGHPLIQTAVPLSLGDSHKGYRIVGTTPDILGLYEAETGEGRVWNATMETTIGAAVAEDLKLKVGDSFHSSHGFVQDENLVHDDAGAFKVVGILKPNGSVIDQLILTNNQSIWAVHEHGGAGHDDEAEETEHQHEEGAPHEHGEAEEPAAPSHEEGSALDKPLLDYPEKEITSILIKFKSRTNYQALNMQRGINENTDLQAATPAIEINRLYALLGTGTKALRWLAIIIVVVSGLSIFISLYSSLRDRRYELALMRVMGASPARLFVLIILEGLLLAVLGYALGIALSHTGMEILAGQMKESYRYTFSGSVFLKEELYLLAGALAIGFFAAILPAIQASRTDISTTLAEG
ncbi:MAG: ABC transporter permease, partial [Phaeodactylibacter sp.]|nr:ABC transporter permease [Phaeodactylibacter sp.]MCB9053685.1 ABC transporter permease [Lewinellaceae bacterium]